ncbi:MAG TPA: glycosyltransferase [Thermoanaerobaculia bacterium]|nr:glycosyltransferase [Thermoanaerobaculia bacterium]
MPPEERRVSVVIPARNEAGGIGRTLDAVFAQHATGVELEVLVVDDGSTDGTAAVASGAGARVVTPGPGLGGSPGAARNRGAAAATGDPIVFLDADCSPGPGWLERILAAHDAGEVAVGGSLDIPPGLAATGRCDHYCGSYHVHPGRSAGYVPNHTPANLSVRRKAFLSTGGFSERRPVADGHEELRWQAQLAGSGARIRFEPSAVVYHHNRLGLSNLLRRNYRWGYSALESKAGSGAVRWAWLYRRPRLLIAASLPLAASHTAHTVLCWARHRILEPLWMLPLIAAARLSYSAGLTVGGLRWLRRRPAGAAEERTVFRR